MNTDAWLLHAFKSGETSARIIFFTEKEGLVHCFYKGARTPKKQALLLPFTPLWLMMDAKNDARFVRHLEMKDNSLQLTKHALFSGMYVNELLYRALKPQESHSFLYEAYQTTLYELSNQPDKNTLEALLRRFEWSLLKALGYAMSFTHEACRELPIQKEKLYAFIPGDGFVPAKDGFLGAHLLDIASDNLAHPDILKAAKWIMRQAIHHALDGQEIKTREFLRARE